MKNKISHFSPCYVVVTCKLMKDPFYLLDGY